MLMLEELLSVEAAAQSGAERAHTPPGECAAHTAESGCRSWILWHTEWMGWSGMEVVDPEQSIIDASERLYRRLVDLVL